MREKEREKRETERNREKKGEKERKGEKRREFNSQKEKINILAEILEISKSCIYHI